MLLVCLGNVSIMLVTGLTGGGGCSQPYLSRGGSVLICLYTGLCSKSVQIINKVA